MLNLLEKSSEQFWGKLLHPYSPLVTLLVGGLISSFVNVTKIPLNIILYCLLLWFVITLMYQYMENKISNMQNKVKEVYIQNEKLNGIIDSKDIEIGRNIGLIEAKYGEFSEYLKHERYKTLERKIVNKFPFVDSVQIYNYTIGVSSDNVKIKISYDSAEEQEGININIIKQKYYNIEKSIYLELLEVIKIYSNLKQPHLYEIEELRQSFIESAFLLLDKLTIDNSPVNQRIFILVVEMLSYIDNDNNDKLLETTLDDCVRSGILGCILTNRDYMYYYNKSKADKIGRIYFSFNDIMEGDNKIITLVVNSNSPKKNDREKEIEEVINYYEDILKTYLEKLR